MKTNNKNKISALVAAVLFLILIALVKLVDTQPVGPEGTVIGLSHINMAVFNILGTSSMWYQLTEATGIIALMVAAGFAVLGLIQLIMRKSLKKVDPEIYALAGLYAVTVFFYALFEVVIINYRPIIMMDETAPEASFPSSHTMLIMVVMGSAIEMCKRFVEADKIRTVLQIVCAVILGLTVAGRLLSGAHWFTDICGGILLSIALLSCFNIVLDAIAERKIRR